jgi:GntR family transcriptional regulator, trigonelline degradation regulator
MPAGNSLKVAPLPVRRQVEDRLRDAIVTGHFLPGEHLSDRALCETFGTSRSVVREAVRTLEAEGLVVVLPNRGPFVASLSVQEAAEIYEVREALEAMAGEGFALRATDEERAALRRIYEELRCCGPEADRHVLLDIKRRFYEVLTNGSRNTYGARMLERLLSRNAQLRAMSLSSPDRLPKTVAEISLIVDAVEKRDAKAAAEACRNHVRQAAAVALWILGEREGLAHCGHSRLETLRL